MDRLTNPVGANAPRHAGVPTLGALEARVMEHLWEHGPDSIANVHRALARSGAIAYTTVATELSRLVKKQLIAKTGSHLDTRYAAVTDRAEFVERLVGDVVATLMPAHQTAAIHGFVEAIAHDDAALKETLRLIQERRRRA